MPLKPLHLGVLLGQLGAFVTRDLPQPLRMEIVSGRHANGIKSRQILGKGTYAADFEIRRLMESKGEFEGGLDLGPDLVLRLPDLLFFSLLATKARGAPVPDCNTLI